MIPATFALESRIAALLAEAPTATFSTPTSRGYVVVKAQAIAGGVRVELRLVGAGPILPDALTAEEYVALVERAERALGEKRGGVDAVRIEMGIADVRAALPEGETCTGDEARAFLEAEGAQEGSERPW